MTLKQIALELLEKYDYAEHTVIGEFSGDIRVDTAELDQEVADYRRRIEEADES